MLTTLLVFVLVPFFQARYANGGLGAMYAMAIGELLMFVAAAVLLREAVDGRTISDVVRSLIAGAATILLFWLLPALQPLLAIPLCVLAFSGLALLVGAGEAIRRRGAGGVFPEAQTGRVSARPAQPGKLSAPRPTRAAPLPAREVLNRPQRLLEKPAQRQLVVSIYQQCADKGIP